MNICYASFFGYTCKGKLELNLFQCDKLSGFCIEKSIKEMLEFSGVCKSSHPLKGLQDECREEIYKTTPQTRKYTKCVSIFQLTWWSDATLWWNFKRLIWPFFGQILADFHATCMLEHFYYTLLVFSKGFKGENN